MATGTPPPKYTYTTITFNYPGTVNLIDVIGVEQRILGTTTWTRNNEIRYVNVTIGELRISNSYNASIPARVTATTVTGQVGFTFSNTKIWREYNNGTSQQATLCACATRTHAAAGSSDCIFLNDNNELEKFTIVPGDLNTEECANGGYDEICVKTIFTQLKNYIYFEDIFGQIRDEFAAFYSSIALEQRIVESIQKLLQRLLAGEITLDQFNELVKIDEQIFASQFAKDYVTNYVTLEQDIQKYKYLLLE
jgi:hypothetical protein